MWDIQLSYLQQQKQEQKVYKVLCAYKSFSIANFYKIFAGVKAALSFASNLINNTLILGCENKMSKISVLLMKEQWISYYVIYGRSYCQCHFMFGETGGALTLRVLSYPCGENLT